MSMVEKKILLTLSTDGDILEHDTSIQLVSSSHMQLKELLEKSTIAKGTELQIDKSRMIYKPFADYATIIYFTLGIQKVLCKTFCCLLKISCGSLLGHADEHKLCIGVVNLMLFFFHQIR